MRTRDQEYAIDAYKHVQAIATKYSADEQSRRRYGSTAHKLPILIRSAGLAQALTFVETRGEGKDNPYLNFLHDLEATVGVEAGSLPQKAREAELEHYMYLTQQVLHTLLWYKRFAQSVLGVDASAIMDDDTTSNEI